MIQRQLLIPLFLFLAGFLLSGCAGKELKKDPFFEKWKIMAEQSQGHSPSHKPRKLDLETTTLDKEILLEEEITGLEKPLPTKRVTLRMHDANIVSVLQALVRAANLNILINSNVKGQVTINVVKSPWNEVFKGLLKTHGLAYAWEGNLIRVMTLEDMEKDYEMESIREKQRKQQLSTSIVRVNYADAANLKTNLETFLSKTAEGNPIGSIVVDSHTNSLIIQATKPDLLRMVKVVDKLDRPRAQIKLKAHIVETTKSTARDLGVQWGGLYRTRSGDEFLYVTPGGNTGSTTSDPLTAGNSAYDPAFGSGLSGQGFGINFPTSGASSGSLSTAGAALGLMFGTIGGNILEAQLSALQSQNRLNILSSPSITTLDNQTAFTENGERVPYVSTTAEGERQVNFEDVTLRLEITPHIIEEDFLKLKIMVKKDEVDTSRSVDGNPFIIKKQTETNLLTRNGETVVISGLTKNRLSETDSGVPGLKKIPLLGWLFKGESKSSSMEEVLIFITPYILPEWQPGEVQMTEEEIEKQIQEEMEEKKESTNK